MGNLGTTRLRAVGVFVASALIVLGSPGIAQAAVHLQSVSCPSVTEGTGAGTTTMDCTIGTTGAGSAISATLTFAGTASGGAACTAGVDYLTPSSPISVPAGGTTVSITICRDAVVESNEMIILTATEGAFIKSGTGTINDDDSPTVAFDAASSSGSEATTPADLAVSLSAASGQTVTVDYAVTGGTATGGGTDFTLLGTGTLSFAPGDTTKNVSLTVVEDALDEADETVVVTLSNPSNASLGANDTHTYTINDNDPAPTVAFDAASSFGSEATTPADLGVSLSAASGKTVTVDYAVTGGTATGGGTDFTLASGTLTFTAGQTTKNVSLTVVEDALDEADETVVVTLSNPSNASLGANDTHTYTINDNDPAPTVAFDAASSFGSEATTPADLAVSLSAASGQTVTVDYAVTGGTATGGGTDYTVASGTLTFTAGQTTKNVSIDVVDDALDEADETVVVTLSNPSNATPGANDTHTYTINDDDGAPTLAIDDVSKNEGDSGTIDFTFTVTKTGATAFSASVDYAVTGGTATAGATCGAGVDYETKSGTLSFAPGDASQQVTVKVCGDNLFENDEGFTLDLSGATNATIADGTGDGTIKNDDAAPALAIDDVTLPEGNSGTTTATFTVSLTAASGLPVTVGWATADGSALAPGDYLSATASMTFTPGQTTKSVSVTVNGDTTFEPNETFSVDLSSASGGTIADGSGLGTITNDDKAPTSLSLKVKKTKTAVTGTGLLTRAVSGMHVKVTLLKLKGKKYRKESSKTVLVTKILDRNGDGLLEGAYTARFLRPAKGKYMFKASFGGDATHLASKKSKKFRL